MLCILSYSIIYRYEKHGGGGILSGFSSNNRT